METQTLPKFSLLYSSFVMEKNSIISPLGCQQWSAGDRTDVFSLLHSRIEIAPRFLSQIPSFNLREGNHNHLWLSSWCIGVKGQREQEGPEWGHVGKEVVNTESHKNKKGQCSFHHWYFHISGIGWVLLILRVSWLVPPAAPSSGVRGRKWGSTIRAEHLLHARSFHRDSTHIVFIWSWPNEGALILLGQMRKLRLRELTNLHDSSEVMQLISIEFWSQVCLDQSWARGNPSKYLRSGAVFRLLGWRRDPWLQWPVLLGRLL